MGVQGLRYFDRLLKIKPSRASDNKVKHEVDKTIKTKINNDTNYKSKEEEEEKKKNLLLASVLVHRDLLEAIEFLQPHRLRDLESLSGHQ